MFAIAECVLHHQQLEDLDLSNNKFGTEIELFCTAMSKICLVCAFSFVLTIVAQSES